jgi:hypothetical protein
VDKQIEGGWKMMTTQQQTEATLGIRQFAYWKNT